MANRLILLIIGILFLSFCPLDKDTSGQSEINTSKPYTYWWWMGSSVTREGITQNLEDMHTAGIGGVHIIPIYGEKGDENNYLQYLSPEWMNMLRHTISEGKRLGMAVDMTSGTGWPFGGPDVSPDDAAKFFYVEKIYIDDKTNINDYHRPQNNTKLITLVTYDNAGNIIDLTSRVDTSGIIQWGNANKPRKVYAAFQGNTLQKVKRAAPGGEGLVIDYYNKSSLLNYMNRFKDAFNQAGIKNGGIRSFYNDSYEVFRANWTDDFLDEFKTRRKYDFLPLIKYLADTIDTEIRQRIITDYCETIAELLFEDFTINWVKQCHEMGSLTRNQAHGSPGNLLDLYALSDIPETESFGASIYAIPGFRQDPDYNEEAFGRPNPLTMKFASSAAHIAGKQLVSSESTTWLGDHFKVSLSQIKPQIDELFVSGINHVFFHGTTYSPKEKAFPGRLFYASTHYGPTSHFWDELPHLTGYISRCQEVLQNTEPDNDILLYFPIHEVWQNEKSGNFIRLFDVHKSKEWLEDTNLGILAEHLWDRGYAFDFISDRMIADLEVKDGVLQAVKTRYKAIVVPAIEYIPEKTLATLKNLAERGAHIIFEDKIPADVPGLFEYQKRRESLAVTIGEMKMLHEKVHVTSDVMETMTTLGIHPEDLASKGLEFSRRRKGNDTFYFITNLSNTFSGGWINLTAQSDFVEIHDPLNQEKGLATIKKGDHSTAVYLQLPPGQSLFLKCSNNTSNNEKWKYVQQHKENTIELIGEWTLTPKQGKPQIPQPVTLSSLGSWTTLGNDYESFSGKAIYKKSFAVPKDLLSNGNGFLLDLGIVRETAKVNINGTDLGLIWCLPNQVRVPAGVIREQNTIEIEVTNLSINRIIQLDKDGIDWKNFHDINFVNIRYQPYDASEKQPEDSGLISNVSLIPVIKIKP